MKFYIDYGTGEPQCCEKDDPGDVMPVADEGATLTQKPILIKNEKGRILARRDWHETRENIRSYGDIIRIGEGFYSDWRMPLYVAVDMD